MANVRAPKKKSHKTRMQIHVDQEELAEIHAYRRKQEVPTDLSKTVRHLISVGLKAKAAA
jgi:hypothetical protein